MAGGGDSCSSYSRTTLCTYCRARGGARDRRQRKGGYCSYSHTAGYVSTAKPEAVREGQDADGAGR